MSGCLCDICKKKPEIIQIEGEGQYCLDCHNERVLKRFGIDDTFHYAPTVYNMKHFDMDKLLEEPNMIKVKYDRC